jgi:ABC-type dipeptide/oligopeptide/nickel transport system permease component
VSLWRRLLQALATLWGASVLVWALVPLAPGDPATRVLLARGVQAPHQAQIAAVRRELDLDRPLPERYGRWLWAAVHGDLSRSYRSGRPVSDELAARLPATLLLASAALALALLVAVPTALAGAAWAGRWPDAVLRLALVLCAAVPSFLVGLFLLEVVVVDGGRGAVISDGDARHVLLPAACLALAIAPAWARLLRAGLVEALRAPHMTVAAARGASPSRRLLVHALPNAAVPFLTALGMSVGALIGGAAIVETVFTWPGIGSYAVAAINGRDLPIIQGFTLMAVLAYVTTSFLVDATARWIDPRHEPTGVPA